MMHYKNYMNRKLFHFFTILTNVKRFNRTNIKNTKETKDLNFISFSELPDEIDEKYSFHMLVENIKYKSYEHNSTKRKELQNKILFHLQKFTINEGIAILVICSKYHFLDFRLCKEILHFLFKNSFFLNNTHMYILVSLIKKNYLGEGICFGNENLEKGNELDAYEKICVEENLKWKHKISESVKKHIDAYLKDETEGKCSTLLVNNNNINFYELNFLEKEQQEEKGNDIILIKNKLTRNVTIPNKEMLFQCKQCNSNSDIQKSILHEKSINDKEMNNCVKKIKSILFHNYNNIQFYIKNNIYCSLYLLNYLFKEDMISMENFLNNIYNINEEIQPFFLDSNYDLKKEMSSKYENDIGKSIIDCFIKEEQKREPLIDLYIFTHFHLVQQIFPKNQFIKDEHILEKIEYNFPLKKEAYTYKKLYIDIFHLFFNICLNLQKDIYSVQLFYLNIVVYEILKLLIDEEVEENIKLHYDILKYIKIDTVLQHEQEPNFLYYLLGIIFYLKKTSTKKNKYKVCLLNCEIDNFYSDYLLFLNTLKNNSLFDIIIKLNDVKEKELYEKLEDNIIGNELRTTFSSEKGNVFFSFFIFDITFNIICYMKNMDMCTLVVIFIYLIKMNFKNDYVIDILREYFFTFFIKRSFYKFNDKKFFFYFINYLLAELHFSPCYFFYLIHFIEVTCFRKILFLFNREILGKISKNLYDGINSLINQQVKNERKYEKNKNWMTKKKKNLEINFNKSSDHLDVCDMKKKLELIQNVLYDFLFF